MTASDRIGDTLQGLARGIGDAGEADAVLFYDGRREARWSFRQLDEASRRLAAGLAAGPEEPIGVCGGNRPEWVVAVLAILRGGASVVPIDTQLGDETFRHVLRDSGIRRLFAGAAQAERFAEACADQGVEAITLDGEAPGWARLSTGAGRPPADVGADDRAALFYTSGTTGPPKGVPLSHRNLVHQIRTLAAAELVAPDERVLVPLPLHHVYPFVIGMLTPLALRRTVVLVGGFTGRRVLDALRRSEATMLIGVPRLYEALVDGIDKRAAQRGRIAALLWRATLSAAAALAGPTGGRAGRWLLRPLHRRLAPRLTRLVSGGAALEPALGRKLEAIGWQVATGYGLTETSPILTFHPPGRGRLDTAGRPIAGIELRIDAADPGQPGEVLARGAGVFGGYHNLPDKTAEALTEDGWFRTGDLGTLDERGELRLAGRASTLIVTAAGKNLQPEEVEAAYAQHPSIAEVAVFEKDGGVAGLAVPAAGLGGDAAEQAVRDGLGEIARGLPSYQRLGDVAVTGEAIPRTRLGKPRRHLIPELFERAKQGQAEVEQRPATLEQLGAEDRSLVEDPAGAAAWQFLVERFPDRRLTPDSALQADLGIDSIDWLDITLEIGERSGVALSEAAVGEMETVRDLLVAIAEGGDGEAALQAPLDDPEAALSPRQRRWLEPRGPVTRAVGRACYGLNRAAVRALLRPRASGLEHLPQTGPVVLAPNHASYLDPFVLAACLDYRWLDEAYWAGWTGVVFGGPLRRAFARVARVLPVESESAVAASLAFGGAAVQRRQALIWFPEGQRSPDGRLQPFRRGLGLLVERFDVPVVPVAIEGTHRAWPVGRRLPRPRPVGVRFLPPQRRDDLQRTGKGDAAAARIVDALHAEISTALRQ